MSRFTHFFRRFFVTEKQTPQTFSLLECMQLITQLIDAKRQNEEVCFLIDNLTRRKEEQSGHAE